MLFCSAPAVAGQSQIAVFIAPFFHLLQCRQGVHASPNRKRGTVTKTVEIFISDVLTFDLISVTVLLALVGYSQVYFSPVDVSMGGEGGYHRFFFFLETHEQETQEQGTV